MAGGTQPGIGPGGGPVGAPVDVLVVGSSRRLAALATAALPRPRFALRFARDMASAMDALFAGAPDAVLVLLERPDEDAFLRCRDLRIAADSAVLALGESASVEQRVAGLRCVDDYVTLPVAPAELAARVAAVVRRTSPCREGGGAVFDDGRLHVDLRTRVVTLGGGPLNLTPTEYRLLALLLSGPGRIFTHDHIIQNVWGTAFAGDSHLVRLQVANLRGKIDPPGGPSYIETHRGVGYSFRAAPSAMPDTGPAQRDPMSAG